MFINKRHELQTALKAQTAGVQKIVEVPALQVQANITSALHALKTLQVQFTKYYEDHWFLGKLVWLFDKIFLRPQAKIIDQIKALDAVKIIEVVKVEIPVQPKQVVKEPEAAKPIEKPVEEEKVKAPEQPPLNREQIRWVRELEALCSGNIRIDLMCANFFESLFRLDRDFVLPITEEQIEKLKVDEWIKNEILEITKLPVPATPEEKCQFSIDMIRRMHRGFKNIQKMRKVFVDAHENIPEAFSTLDREFYNNFKDRIYSWIREYDRTYRDAQCPKAQIRIPMEASSIYIKYENESPSLPQEIVWDPSTGQLTAHLKYYLVGKGKQEKDIDLSKLEHDNRSPVCFYAGCMHYGSDADNIEEELVKADEAGLPCVGTDPEPVFDWSFPNPKGGLSLETMLKMVDAIEAQIINNK